jgi:phosphoribosyl 1,2-cyclic phosphate phosphodiesterase
MKVTFLGTGTSQGVPIIGCKCTVCSSQNPKDKRLRSSIMIESETTCVVIDTGPDFRQQMLREDVCKLDAVLFTHSHKDHMAGMDDIRAFNYLQQKDMDIYATLQTQEVIKKDFDYIFNNSSYPGVPKVNLFNIHANENIRIGDMTIIPIEVMHYKMPVLGFRVNNFTYITDANFIADDQFEKIKGSTILVLNALRRETHISHFTLDQAIEVSMQVAAKQTYFTHISHQLGLHEVVNQELPAHIQLAYDGLCLEI